ncbi:polysaccharide deacetylase family protein [Mycolicibacterium sp. 050158]|jgi:peptidoglycan-N-acetylglucosamine deacetylase|uniref:polysaccharide deacetylase family protein n=1 Tax=Mycolicibacterium sp. 050158 TaxID=3090602 RepID=UPI00299F237D|nr:polysaccharide deacetylase family protein [Mycolicibacterium sp. 050158]MDX1892955.1 polysaccharide deacetylase family protein [Mycolicibacterium sp. 050158]
MVELTRRTFMGVCALGVAAAATPAFPAKAVPPTIGTARVAPPVGVLTRLPGDGTQLALTVDDGCSTADVAALGRFCADTGMRMTFFVNGVNPSWMVNADLLRPMVASGQIQLGNHTWSHPHITKISPAALDQEIGRNADFLRDTYGVDGTPYFRPPYGSHDAATDRIAANHGYTTIALWSAEIGDSRPIDEAGLIANAHGCFQPQQIVLMHANLPPISHVLPQLADVVAAKGLQTVTLADVFAS